MGTANRLKGSCSGTKSRQNARGGGNREGFLEEAAHYSSLSGQIGRLEGTDEGGGPVGMLSLKYIHPMILPLPAVKAPSNAVWLALAVRAHTDHLPYARHHAEPWKSKGEKGDLSFNEPKGQTSPIWEGADAHASGCLHLLCPRSGCFSSCRF